MSRKFVSRKLHVQTVSTRGCRRPCQCAQAQRQSQSPVYGPIRNAVASKAQRRYESVSSSTKKPQKVTSSFSRPRSRPP